MEYFDLIFACNDDHTNEQLKALQDMPLWAKVEATKIRILEFYNRVNGDVYLSFSGGKDSTVLAYITNTILKLNIPLVFANTGLEFIQIQKFATYAGAEFVKPDMRFDKVIQEYGYPLISKEVANSIYYARKADGRHNNVNSRKQLLGEYRQEDSQLSMFNMGKWLLLCQEMPMRISAHCCSRIKKSPLEKYQRANRRSPMIATMTDESRRRKSAWLRTGCNSFDGENSKSRPMAFWTQQDVLQFIIENKIKICSVYGDICNDESGNIKCSKCNRTGCVYCMFGAHIKNNDRFILLSELSPKQYDYAMRGGQWIDNPEYSSTIPRHDGQWINWNPKRIWVPSKDGLGLKKVITLFNSLYPNDKINLPE